MAPAIVRLSDTQRNPHAVSGFGRLCANIAYLIFSHLPFDKLRELKAINREAANTARRVLLSDEFQERVVLGRCNWPRVFHALDSRSTRIKLPVWAQLTMHSIEGDSVLFDFVLNKLVIHYYNKDGFPIISRDDVAVGLQEMLAGSFTNNHQPVIITIDEFEATVYDSPYSMERESLPTNFIGSVDDFVAYAVGAVYPEYKIDRTKMFSSSATQHEFGRKNGDCNTLDILASISPCIFVGNARYYFETAHFGPWFRDTSGIDGDTDTMLHQELAGRLKICPQFSSLE